MSTITQRSSVATPLQQRIVCARCGHLHRRFLRRKCECCAADYEAIYGSEQSSV